MVNENSNANPPRAMTIAGSDSGGGAGIQADLKTFAAFGVYGTSAVTAITAQNTRGVNAVQTVDLEVIAGQINAVISDIGADAVKIGMLANSEIVQLVAEKLRQHASENVVVDPVMVATSGDRLLSDGAVQAIKSELIPLASIVTPNLDEAMVLTDRQIEDIDDMKEAALVIHSMGAASVLVKGGHSSASDDDGQMRDVLYDGVSFTVFADTRIDTTSTHGTGCTLSSAIASGLARGRSIQDSVADAKAYLTESLNLAFPVGEGHGPVNHFFGWWNGAGREGKGGASHEVTREPG